MANRHLSRTVIIQALYEWDFKRDQSIKQIAKRGIDAFAQEVDRPFVSNILTGVTLSTDELDRLISSYAPEWPLEQIAVIDKTLLRAAVYELLHLPKTPPRVVINESVELAKSFGGENSAKFINGVLGTIYRTHPDIKDRGGDEEVPLQEITHES
ncbi:transcription antitermination factor NusB [Candidatus Berkelbacteria bacterium]|nr:transcription antitermination factor NusB [Candidatus Berkelbacteria bacterium]